MDPGGVHTCGLISASGRITANGHTCVDAKPSRMGDVCISLLLCDDLPLAHHLRPWSAQKQQCLGYSGEQRVDYSLCVCVMNWL